MGRGVRNRTVASENEKADPLKRVRPLSQDLQGAIVASLGAGACLARIETGVHLGVHSLRTLSNSLHRLDGKSVTNWPALFFASLLPSP